MGTIIDDFNGENFDHAGLGFFGGGYINCASGGAPPIGGRSLPHGTPRWGSDWKAATAKWYRSVTRFNTQGSVYANRDNFLDLDPTYTDKFGDPILRFTLDWTEHEHKQRQFAYDLAAKVEWAWKHPQEMEAMGRSARMEFETKYSTSAALNGLECAYEAVLARRNKTVVVSRRFAPGETQAFMERPKGTG